MQSNIEVNFREFLQAPVIQQLAKTV